MITLHVFCGGRHKTKVLPLLPAVERKETPSNKSPATSKSRPSNGATTTVASDGRLTSQSSPAMLLMEKAGYDPVKQATLEVITSALANPVSGPLAESAEQCVEDTQASANTIILQTIAAADWEGGYKLSLMQNLARRVGLAGGKPACISNIRNRC